MSKKTQNGCSLCESLLRKTFGSAQKKRKSEPQKRKMEFTDIPISNGVNVGDVVYTKGKAVLDIGIVKNVHPLEVYSRYAKHNICSMDMPSQYDSVNLRSPSPDVDGVSDSPYTSSNLITDGQPKVGRGLTSIDDEAERCHWYNSGVNVSMQQWKRISTNAGTEEVCRRIGIPYLREW